MTDDSARPAAAKPAKGWMARALSAALGELGAAGRQAAGSLTRRVRAALSGPSLRRGRSPWPSLAARRAAAPRPRAERPATRPAAAVASAGDGLPGRARLGRVRLDDARAARGGGRAGGSLVAARGPSRLPGRSVACPACPPAAAALRPLAGGVARAAPQRWAEPSRGAGAHPPRVAAATRARHPRRGTPRALEDTPRAPLERRWWPPPLDRPLPA